MEGIHDVEATLQGCIPQPHAFNYVYYFHIVSMFDAFAVSNAVIANSIW